jgi:hypothetical protein
LAIQENIYPFLDSWLCDAHKAVLALQRLMVFILSLQHRESDVAVMNIIETAMTWLNMLEKN